MKTIFSNSKLYLSAFWTTIAALVITYLIAYSLVDTNNKAIVGFFLLLLPLPIIFLTGLLVPLFTYDKKEDVLSKKWYQEALALWLISSLSLFLFDAFYYYVIDTSIVEALSEGVAGLSEDVQDQGGLTDEDIIANSPYLWQISEMIVVVVALSSLLTHFILYRRQNPVLTTL